MSGERSCRECGGEGRNEVLGLGWYCDAHVPTRDEALALVDGSRSTFPAIHACPHCDRYVSALPALQEMVQRLTDAIRIDPTLDHACNGEGDDPKCDECRYLAAVKEALNG